MFRKLYLKQNQTTDLNVGGYGGSPTNPTSVPPPPPAVQSQNPAPSQAPGNNDNLDEYGYEIVPSVEAKPTTPPQAQGVDPKAQAQAVAPATEPVAGYGKDPVVVPPVTPPAAATEIKLEYELDVKDLSPAETEQFKKLAADHKLPKEAAQALVDLRKKENSEVQLELQKIKTDNENKIAQQKASWHNDLLTDPKFGGENFLHNLARVDKVLTTLMPDTKKILTERKSMLPPYVMRDLLTVYNSLYSTDELVGGQPMTPPEVEKESSPLDFYT